MTFIFFEILPGQMSGVGEKRRSRFEDKVDSEPEPKRAAIDISAVAARAAEMSRELSSKVNGTCNFEFASLLCSDCILFTTFIDRDGYIATQYRECRWSPQNSSLRFNSSRRTSPRLQSVSLGCTRCVCKSHSCCS